MWHEIEGALINFSCFVRSACCDLFEDRVIEPQVDIAFPEALLLDRWHVEYGPIVDLTGSHYVNLGLLLKRTVVEPKVVVQGLCCQSFL